MRVTPPRKRESAVSVNVSPEEFSRNVSPKGRDHRIDTIKGFLIITVVIGHLLEHTFTKGIVNIASYLFIYSFHMPAFIFIAGYMFKPQNSYKKLAKSTLMLLETYLIFQFLDILLFDGPDKLNPYDVIFHPTYGMWFIPCLIWWRILTKVVFEKLKLTKLVAVIAFVSAALLSCLIGFWNYNGKLPILRFFVFLPFFFAGICYKRFDFGGNRLRWSLLSILILTVSIIAVLKFNNRILLDLSLTLYGSVPYHSSFDILLRVLVLSVSFLLTILYFKYIKENIYIRKIGEVSLLIYVMHLPIARAAQEMMVYGMMKELISVLFLASVIISVIYVLSKFISSKFLLNPITSLISLF